MFGLRAALIPAYRAQGLCLMSTSSILALCGSFLDKVTRELVLGLDCDHQKLCLFCGTHEVSCIFVAKANVDLTNKH